MYGGLSAADGVGRTGFVAPPPLPTSPMTPSSALATVSAGSPVRPTPRTAGRPTNYASASPSALLRDGFTSPATAHRDPLFASRLDAPQPAATSGTFFRYPTTDRAPATLSDDMPYRAGRSPLAGVAGYTPPPMDRGSPARYSFGGGVAAPPLPASPPPTSGATVPAGGAPRNPLGATPQRYATWGR